MNDNLPSGPPRTQLLKRLDRILQLIRAVDLHAQLPLLHPLPQRRNIPLITLQHKNHILPPPTPQEPGPHHPPHKRKHRHRTNLHKLLPRKQERMRLRVQPLRQPNMVDDMRIHLPPGTEDTQHILLGIVNDLIGPQILAELHIARRTRRRDGTPQRLGNLDREDPAPARTPVDKHPVTLRNIRRDRLVRRLRGDAYGGCVVGATPSGRRATFAVPQRRYSPSEPNCVGAAVVP
ncbi:hypothetical protein GB937_009079 [Aspergillus fischeri]|nr:hypothetical protein GB937_009079 [Aspergillus fischeri]